ncbi:MAG: dynamin-like GTPase family protein [Snowella sp.]|nr:dynamin-like GTPase family protein [Snowella sp.]
MAQLPPQCANLREQVNQLLDLLNQEVSLRSQFNTSKIETSLKKAIAHKFEIVFAGAFSAGKSMLINALLERELLYSAEGHATGTECHIEYAEPGKEEVVLTFLSEVEIREQVTALSHRLNLQAVNNINQSETVQLLEQQCQKIIEQEGGASKSDKAKQAYGLILLLEGFSQNRDKIHTMNNATYSMEQLNFSNLTEAAGYARRGSNSAVLKRLDYHCCHPLLQDGNVLVDLPGIDAPVKKDADLTYRKIEDPDSSAVVCVLKAASAGEMTTEETELLEKMRSNLGIRDRVFYVFNRIDDTWYNTQLRQRLESLIQNQFQGNSKLYQTSGLLGFFGSLIKQTTGRDRFGLDTIFADSIKGFNGEEETPQFVNEFNNYCGNSKKLLTRTDFKVSVNSYETPNENYVRILSEWGTPLLDQLIQDSGIKSFRDGVTRYLAEEKYPELFKTLADDLQPLCISLKSTYLKEYHDLDSQPREIEAMKAQELTLLNQSLQDLGVAFREHIALEVNNTITNLDREFEEDFIKLKNRMVTYLDELLKNFSVGAAYRQATLNHPRNATAPFIAVLVEALYYLSNELEDVLVVGIKDLVKSFSQRLLNRVRQTDHYREISRLLGKDAGIEIHLKQVEEDLTKALVSAAIAECDSYVRESPRFYDEGTFSIYQFRETLQQTNQGYDAESIIAAEPAIRQLLKLDVEPKVFNTVRKTFRQKINQAMKTHLLPMAEKQADEILQQYDVARSYLQQTLEKEAEEKIARNSRLQGTVKGKIDAYNEAISAINECLKAMQLYQLPLITQEEFSVQSEVIKPEVIEVDLVDSADIT